MKTISTAVESILRIDKNNSQTMTQSALKSAKIDRLFKCH